MIKHLKISLSVLMTAAILLTGCDKEVPLPDHEEISVTGTTSEIVTISDSTVAETLAAESEAVTKAKSYEPYQLRLYDSLGTGIPRPDDYGEDLSYYYFGGELNEILPLMKNKESAGKIRQEAKALLDYANENYYLYGDGGDAFSQGKISSYCTGYNRFLFYSIYYSGLQMAHCAVFDMETGNRLELSDLFFEGEDFLTLLNKKIGEEIQKLIWEDYENEIFEYMPMKREFAGLTEDGFYFDTISFYFPVTNPYFARCESVSIVISDFDTVLNVPYDITTLFETGAGETLYIRKYTSDVISIRSAYSKTLHTGNINIYLFDGSMYLTAEQEEFLNDKATGITKILDKLNQQYDWTAYTDGETPLYNIYISPDGTEYKNKDIYVININLTDNIAQITLRKDNAFEAPNPCYTLHYDLDALELLDTEQLFERVFGDNAYIWDYIWVSKVGEWNGIDNIEGFIDGKTPKLNKLKPEYLSINDTEIHYDGKFDDYFAYGTIRSAN